MKLVFTPRGWKDYLWFQEHDRKLLKRINLLIQDAHRTPFSGIGKPESRCAFVDYPRPGELSRCPFFRCRGSVLV